MISSPVTSGSGEYLMKLSLGTPSRLYWATLDTSSDLIRTTCCPCDSCSGKTSMFDPFQSSTYKSQSRSSSSCMELATETLLFDDGAGTIELPGIENVRFYKIIASTKDAI
ncbi:hypothetical protein EJ110_NYTH28412 [Nymphaea thermarum]|nr:hypothetical protein EJ110_NYTH28412 [Nymphaea thermarum]